MLFGKFCLLAHPVARRGLVRNAQALGCIIHPTPPSQYCMKVDPISLDGYYWPRKGIDLVVNFFKASQLDKEELATLLRREWKRADCIRDSHLQQILTANLSTIDN